MALKRPGKKLYDKAIPQAKPKDLVLIKLAGHGKVLVVVDQPATISALPVAVAQAAETTVGQLKRALFLSAFSALHHAPFRAYYNRKRAEGKRNIQAIIAMARRHSDILFGMLLDGTLYKDLGPRSCPQWIGKDHKGTNC